VFSSAHIGGEGTLVKGNEGVFDAKAVELLVKVGSSDNISE